MHTTHATTMSRRALELAELLGLDDDQIDSLDNGGELKMPCPAHGGTNDKLYVKVGNNSELIFHCFSGGCSYDEIVAAIRGSEVAEHKPRLRVVKDGPKQLSAEAQRRLESVCDQWAEGLQKLDELHPAWALLKDRGIDRKQAKELGLGYGGLRGIDELDIELGLARKTEGSDYHNFQPYHHRLVVPLYDPSGILLGFAGRALDGNDRKWINPRSEDYDKSSYLYGESTARELLKDTSTLVICEGYWDQIACARSDLASVAIGGTSLTEGQISRIVDLHPELVVWAADGDVPGRMAAAKGCAKIAAAGLTVAAITAPDGKDPADMGDDALAEAVAATTPSTITDLIALAMMGVDLDDETSQKTAASCVKAILKSWPDAGEAKAAMTPQLAHTLGLKVEQLRKVATQPTEDEEKQSATVKMLGLAESMYEIFCDHSGELWIARAGSHVVKPFSPNADEVVNRLLAAYFATHDEAPPSRIAGDALRYLAGVSYDSDRITVSQRVTEVDEVIYVDLGRKDEQVLVIEAGQPPVVDDPPEGVYYSRSGRYGELPLPKKTAGVNIDTLWEHIRVAEEDRPIVLAWILSAWMSIQTPILLLEGSAGASKSTSTRRILSLLDPAPKGDSGLRLPPKDNEALTVSLGASSVVAIDNLSYIDAEMSNTLCQAASGGEVEKRRLYKDNEVFSINVSSSVILTGIDLGTLAGDLSSRLAACRLDAISTAERIPEDQLEKSWEQVRAGLVWVIADLLSRVKAILPNITLAESPRMASFGRVLAAVDQIMGTGGLSTFLAAERARQKEVALNDPLATELIRWMNDGSNWIGRKPEWSGTSAELLHKLTNHAGWQEGREPKGWPKTANALGMRITKLTTPLATEGIEVKKGRNNESRLITIRKLSEDAPPPEVEEDEDDFEPPTAARRRAVRREPRPEPVEKEEEKEEFVFDEDEFRF